MRQDNGHVQEKIDNFLGRKMSQYPDVEEYARDVYKLENSDK